MKRNLGGVDRVFRALGAAALLTCGVLAPLPLGVRMLAFGTPGVYLLISALTGMCLGYRWMSKSTCPSVERP
jgi:hypothetical protein